MLADASYWDAIGTYNAWFDGTVRYSDMGAWVNMVEKQLAYDDTEYWTEIHNRKRVATLDQDEGDDAAALPAQTDFK